MNRRTTHRPATDRPAARRIGTALAAVAAMLATAPLAQAAGPTHTDTLYAAPHGAGTSCTHSRPCSLDGARDKARTLDGDDVTVQLAGVRTPAPRP